MAHKFITNKFTMLLLGVFYTLTLMYVYDVRNTKTKFILTDIVNKESLQSKQLELLDLKIMTFNIFQFRNDNKNKNTSIHSTIIDSNADIVLIQEDIFPKIRSSNGISISGYERVIQCKTHPKKPNSIGNSILVSQKYLKTNQIIKIKSMDVTEGCPTQRCATFVEFNNGLSIVNTHFCGGKYDDRHFANKQSISHSIIDAKNDALHKIWNQFGNFTIIGGDFNGMSNHSLNAQLFKSYPLYKSMSDTNKKHFANFFGSPHMLLRQNAYSPTYDEIMVNKTAQIGPKINVPDWIYINSQIKYSVKAVHVYDAITKPNDFSDHNPVSVTLTYQLNKSIDSTRINNITFNGYYVLHSNTNEFQCITALPDASYLVNNCNGLNEQVFVINLTQQLNNHKYYTIQSNQSKLYLTGNINTSALYQSEYNGYDNQLFEFIYDKQRDKYNIKMKQNGRNINSKIFLDIPSDDALHQLFAVYDYFNEIITVAECIENIPLIQRFIQHNIIDPTQYKYFPNKNMPTNAINFFYLDYNNSESNRSVYAYHGAINPNSYESIFFEHEGLKGRVVDSWKFDVAQFGPVVFVTPSYILATHHYGTMYEFKDYIYSLTLQVKVDTNKRIKSFPNACTMCRNIDPNISDKNIEWIYKDHDVHIYGIIVKKYRKEAMHMDKHISNSWRKNKLKWKHLGKHIEGYI